MRTPILLAALILAEPLHRMADMPGVPIWLVIVVLGAAVGADYLDRK